MNLDQTFKQALQNLDGPNRDDAVIALRNLAEQRHVPATFAYADVLFGENAEAAYTYLTNKFQAGLIGAAYRAVLTKVFFTASPLQITDIEWLDAEARKHNLEALLVLLLLSEDTDIFGHYLSLLWQLSQETAHQLKLMQPVANQPQFGRAEFEGLCSKYNKNKQLKPTLVSTDIGMALYQNVFSPMMCRHFVLKFNPHMQPSLIYDPKTGAGKPNSVRTSTYLQVSGMHIDWFSLEAEKRLAALAGLPASQGEPLSVLKYEPNQQYKPHYDAFVGEDNAVKAMLEDGGQRVKTQICYLQSAHEGGETAFTRKGMTVNPPAGSVLMFDNVDDDNKVLTASYHAGLPVKSGVKWIMTKWIRAKTTRYGQSIYTLKRK